MKISQPKGFNIFEVSFLYGFDWVLLLLIFALYLFSSGSELLFAHAQAARRRNRAEAADVHVVGRWVVQSNAFAGAGRHRIVFPTHAIGNRQLARGVPPVAQIQTIAPGTRGDVAVGAWSIDRIFTRLVRQSQ